MSQSLSCELNSNNHTTSTA